MVGYFDKTYNDNLYDWRRIKDFVAGERTVKSKAKSSGYINIPSGITKADKQKEYIDRGFFPELTNTALNEANGRIFQQAPILPDSEVINRLGEDFYKNVDGANTSFEEMIAKVVNNLNSTTRCGILVDYTNNGEYRTEAERKKSGSRMIWTFYDTLDILSVRTDKLGRILKIELGETLIDDFKDINEEEELYNVHRILFIDPVDGIYKQRLYREQQGNKYEPISEDIIPLKNGQPLTEIPFVFFNGKTNNHEVYKPRLLDMVETVNSIYKNWTDLEHMIYNICTPIRYGTGITDDEASSMADLGPQKMWFTKNSDANFGVLDVDGRGLEFVYENIDRKLKLAERFGYVFLDSGAKTATQSLIETTGRIITLQDIADSTTEGIKACLDMSFDWELGSVPDYEFKINIKTDDGAFAAEEFKAMIAAYQRNVITKRDMFKYQTERKITNQQYDEWERGLEDTVNELNPITTENQID